jgi:hypothetical protein
MIKTMKIKKKNIKNKKKWVLKMKELKGRTCAVNTTRDS